MHDFNRRTIAMKRITGTHHPAGIVRPTTICVIVFAPPPAAKPARVRART